MTDYESILKAFSKVKVLVAGDAILDSYHFGTVERISPEAPVPVFIEDYDKQEVRRGGADNVAHQLEAWGCQVETLFPKRRSVKHRYLVGHHQLFRRDSDSNEVCEEVPEFGDPDVIVLSDYNKGFLTHEVCQALIKAAVELKVPVVVDPKGKHWGRYLRATVICPNEKEFQQVSSMAFSFPRIVLKRGESGIRLIEGNQPIDIPAKKVPVFDVTGAGDTVVAAISVTLGSGIGSLEIASRIAVEAASVVVQKVGTSICTLEELRCALGLPTGGEHERTTNHSGISESQRSEECGELQSSGVASVDFRSSDSRA